jgi:ribose 5-phosphate isomerase A
MAPSELSKTTNNKRAAALVAAAQVESGMRLGLGSGSTAAFAVEAIGERWRRRELASLVCVATSQATAELASRFGLPLVPLEEIDRLDLAIDGADEVDPRGDLIKGGGGALLREKAVERRADRLVIVVDGGKLSAKLGTKFDLPVEVVPAACQRELDWLASQQCTPRLRGAASPFVTDNGNHILDCHFDAGIDAPHELARLLEGRPGVRAHGLFLDMTSEVIVADEQGVRSLHFR